MAMPSLHQGRSTRPLDSRTYWQNQRPANASSWGEVFRRIHGRIFDRRRRPLSSDTRRRASRPAPPGDRTRASANGTSANGQRAQHAWYDHDAEQQLLVELLIYPHYLDDILAIARPDDFSPPGGNAYQALVELTRAHGRISAHLVAHHELVNNPDLEHTLEKRTSIGAPRAYARHLAILARRRRVAATADILRQAAVDGDDARIAQTLATVADDLRAAPSDPAALVDVDELLAETDIDHDWLIPGLLERGDRFILTAAEGDGKSTLLRQIGLRCAAGRHPFTGDPITPVRTVVVDCENSRRQVRRAIAKMRAAADTYEPGFLRIECRPAGLDLLDPVDQAWLHELVTTHQPDMLMIGPLYKMAAGDPIKEETAREIANTIDAIRARTGVTVVMEAHTPYADGSKSKRPLRPYGASLWSRWPEFGICLTDTGALKHWRGPREERAWPAALARSTPWPWEPRDDITSEWEGPTDCMALVAKLFAENPTLELGKSAVPTQLKALYGSSFRRDTVYVSLEHLVVDGRLTARTGPRQGRYYRHAATESDEPVEMF